MNQNRKENVVSVTAMPLRICAWHNLWYDVDCHKIILAHFFLSLNKIK